MCRRKSLFKKGHLMWIFFWWDTIIKKGGCLKSLQVRILCKFGHSRRKRHRFSTHCPRLTCVKEESTTVAFMNTLKAGSSLRHQHSITQDDCSLLFNNKWSDKSLTHKNSFQNTIAEGAVRGKEEIIMTLIFQVRFQVRESSLHMTGEEAYGTAHYYIQPCSPRNVTNI